MLENVDFPTSLGFELLFMVSLKILGRILSQESIEFVRSNSNICHLKNIQEIHPFGAWLPTIETPSLKSPIPYTNSKEWACKDVSAQAC